MDQLATQQGNGEQALRVRNATSLDLATVQEIESGLVGLVAESMCHLIGAARRLVGEAARASSGMLTEIAKATEDVGSAIAASASGLAKAALNATADVLREAIAVSRELTDGVGAASVQASHGTSRAARAALTDAIGTAAEVATALLPPRPLPAA